MRNPELGQSLIGFRPNGDDPSQRKTGVQHLKIAQAKLLLRRRRRPVRQPVGVFVRVKGENVPQDHFPGRSAGIENRSPDDGGRGLIEAFFPANLPDAATGAAAGALAGPAQNRPGVDPVVVAQQHPLRSHGNAGKMSPLIAQRLGDKNVAGLAQPKPQILLELTATNRRRGGPDIEFAVEIPPRIIDLRRRIGLKFRNQLLNLRQTRAPYSADFSKSAGIFRPIASADFLLMTTFTSFCAAIGISAGLDLPDRMSAAISPAWKPSL